MSNTTQCRKVPDGASGSSTTRTKLRVPSGAPDHDNGGEMSAPSQVYCAGISLPGGIAGLASIRGMAVSALPEFRSPDRDNPRVSQRVAGYERDDALPKRTAGVPEPDAARSDRSLRGSCAIAWGRDAPGVEEPGPGEVGTGLTIQPMATLASCPPLDLILVPGGGGHQSVA